MWREWIVSWCDTHRLYNWYNAVEACTKADIYRLDTIIPECVARVPVSLWGPGGWGCVRSTLRNRSQPSATVRSRPREPRMGVPMVSSAKGVIFGGLKRRVASFRVAGVALRDIQTCFAACGNSFCVAGAILLRRFQKMHCSFRGRRSTLDVSIVILRGRRITLDVSCCVFFCESHCQGCVKWRQGANSVASVAFCEMWWKLTEASHKTSTLRTSILKLQSMKIGGSLARNARFDAPACLVSSLWFSCGLAVSMREVAKPILFRRFPSRLSCRFAWQAWHCDIPTCLITCRKSFCVAGAIFLRRFHKMSCSFRGRRSTLKTSIAILRGRRSTSDVSHCVLYTSHSTLYTPHSALYTSHFTFHTPHFTPPHYTWDLKVPREP